MATSSYPGEGHPWADFLHYRVRAMRWMRDEQRYDVVTIAAQLSMDAVQVARILAYADAIEREPPPSP
jgi:hypothetical protein